MNWLRGARGAPRDQRDLEVQGDLKIPSISRDSKKEIARTVVLGVGNILLRDEGFGVFLTEELARRRLPEGVSVVDGSMVGRDFAPLLQENDRIILVNTQKRDLSPATLFKSSLAEVSDSISRKETSLDQLAFFAALEDLTFAGIKKEVVVISLVPKIIDVGMGLTDEGKQALPRAIEMVLGEIG